ncbi:MAG: hypothetical protein ACD_18C00257G0005 [uncultured bacterium]|uniref:SHOCT domain-containing protein n=1 Tax=Candidatus Magasanikbacteria bacterium RIFOXYD2_FULL_36_9 TaxID=1798707 RepID=A0A1F6P0I4_9BACT|nr:MAG: hypothetical protein ACD_18C00257G0005 [uncultured bacterium]OGH89628.1 MAG: hypothetical protein A2537_01775 [Candidatus Magasanikbacteria bacterium RIFOXYD2_FULL_36_9]
MMYYGFASFGWIFMFVFWCIVIGVVVAVVRGGFGKGHMCGHNHGDNAREKGKSSLDILKDRYAKGESNKKEFEGKKKDLE